MKRRRFLLGSVSSVLTGATVFGGRPVLGVTFDVYQPKDLDAKKVDSILISFENFTITPRYLNDDEDIELSIKATTENGNSEQKTADVGFTNDSLIDEENIQDVGGQDLTQLHITGVNATDSFLSGEVIVQVNHPSIQSRTFRRQFIVSPSEIPPDGVSRWTFDDADTNNSTAIDVWNTNDGGLSNVTTGRSGQLNQSYEFSQSSESYVNVPHSQSLQLTQQLSFSFWLYVDSFPPSWVLLLGKVAEGTNTSGRTYSIWLNDSGYFHLTSASDEQGQTNIDTPNGSVQTGTWIHYVGVIDRVNGSMKSYINGTEKASGSIDTNEAVTHTDPLRIGYDNYTNDNYYALDGRLDDVRLYSKVLSPDEVQSLYENDTIL